MSHEYSITMFELWTDIDEIICPCIILIKSSAMTKQKGHRETFQSVETCLCGMHEPWIPRKARKHDSAGRKSLENSSD